MSDPTRPSALSARLGALLKQVRLDPAALPILVAGLVLVGAVLWLLGRPMPPPAPAFGAGLEQRIAALEARPAAAAPDLAPLRAEIAALRERPAAAAPDLAPLEARIAALAARPVPPAPDLSGLAPRSALNDYAPRSALADLAPRAALDSLARDLQARTAAAEQAQGQTGQRLTAAEAALAQRSAALEAAVARLATLEAGLAQRDAALAAQAARIAALEGTAQRFAALEGRAARLATLDALRAALEAGQPLGGALATLPNAPAALTRFATAAPPTEAALRLGFEDAARAGRAASDPATQGASVLDSAVSRLSGLVTVRRGEELVWGDAALAEIERARRAVEAGDLEAALARLARLSAPAKEAMRGWLTQAEALVAARAALRSLAAG
jgi:hypothetical protein